jgi:hypothetical protein
MTDAADGGVPSAGAGHEEERQETETETETETDGGERTQAHTVRLELVDEPGQLLAALGPIAENGGNLLSIFHERGNITPRGRIPVEVDLECPTGSRGSSRRSDRRASTSCRRAPSATARN